MALSIKLTGSKVEFIQHLEAKRQEHLSMAKDATGTAKPRHMGIAEGLEIASRQLARWETPEEAAAGNGQHGGFVGIETG
jgi:hypothetical protein